MDLILLTMLACVNASPTAVSVHPPANPAAVAQVRAGDQEVAHASWWGFDPNDATAALQSAIDSGAKKVIVEDMNAPWVLDPVRLANDQELVLENGVVLLARRGAFKGRNDCLLSASGKRNVRITSSGATLRMWRDDYDRPPYEKAEWRHAISIRSCTNVCIGGLTIVESGGDGIYLGVSQRGVTNTNVEIRDVLCDRNYRQGISVISAENLRIENVVLRNTAGTAPMAGIDFEPNYSTEPLVNCVMRNCRVEGNSGDGFLFALHNLNRESTPVSIRLESCVSLGNRNGFRLHTGNGELHSCVSGSIETVDCRFEASEQAGISVGNKPVDGCRLRFKRCRIIDAAKEHQEVSPIVFMSRFGSTENIGGVEFVDCVVVDSGHRLPLDYRDRAGGLKLAQVTGTLTVERADEQTMHHLDQKLLDQWFPFQAFKQFPPFPMGNWHWETGVPEPNTQDGRSCAVRQRGHGEFGFLAESGQEIAFTLGLQRVGRTGTPQMAVAVLAPSGERSDMPEMRGEGQKDYEYRVAETGLHRIVCEAGTGTTQVVSSNCPVALYSKQAPFHLLGTTGNLYFCVPAGIREFGIRISGGGERENAKAVLYDPAGRKVAEEDNIEGHQFLLQRPSAAGTEIWRLQMAKPSQGVIEDYYVHLQAIPPILATSPETVLRPLPRLHFPSPGAAIENHDPQEPEKVGLDSAVVRQINDFVAAHPYARSRVQPRWALWRHGRLVHVEGDFHRTVDVASLRKTWHAMIVGAAIQQGRIPSLDQKLSEWLPELRGNHAEATWRHVITQSAGFDYPHGDHPAYQPGEMWTYSDWNLVHLCNALARMYGRQDYHDRYDLVAKQAYFDTIGMEGWSTVVKVDVGFGREDGVRFELSLEHMGRLGLLALARGRWADQRLVPEWFVRQLETKQTYGMKANYNGPNDGRIALNPRRFEESPYGFLTWVNTDKDYFPGADRTWAWGSGAGGTKVLWNHNNGIVFTGVGIQMSPSEHSIPHILEQSLLASGH